MKINKYIFVSILSFLLVLVSCGTTANVPSWVTDVHSVYNEQKYFCQFASSRISQDDAKHEAMNLIAQFFSTKVSSQAAQVKTLNIDENGNTQKNVAAVTAMNVSSDVELYCVEYEFFHEKKNNEWFCVAFIERDKAWNFFLPKMDREKTLFEEYYKLGQQDQVQSSLLAIRDYKQAQSHLNQLQVYMDYAGTLKPENLGYYDSTFIQGRRLNTMITQLKRNSKFYINVENDLDNSISIAIKNIISAEGFAIHEKVAECPYKILVKIQMNDFVQSEIVVAEPTLDLVMEDAKKNVLFTYSDSVPKLKAYTRTVIDSKTKKFFTENLEKTLVKNIYDNL